MSDLDQIPVRGDCTNRIDIRLIRDPVDFFAEEHMRQRLICAEIDALAAAEDLDRERIKPILDHIQNEMPVHIQDEEQDMFPLLRRRATPEDAIEKTLSRLHADHGEGERLGSAAVDALVRASETNDPLSDRERADLVAFAAHERRHLIVENAIILPLARARLTAGDRETLGLRMAARRGICLLPEPKHA